MVTIDAVVTRLDHQFITKLLCQVESETPESAATAQSERRNREPRSMSE